MGTLDHAEILDAPILERGEVSNPGQTVSRSFPRVIGLNETAAPPKDQSGRVELAQWLTHPDNPLTARVMANRIWKHLFGEGIVRSTDNFGFTGDRPDHPECLITCASLPGRRLVRQITYSGDRAIAILPTKLKLARGCVSERSRQSLGLAST